MNVDVSPEILELPQPTLELAVAQIVFTSSELAGVSDVRLRVDGQPQAWPDGRGELQTDAATVYDYPGLVESTQPSFPAVPSEPRWRQRPVEAPTRVRRRSTSATSW